MTMNASYDPFKMGEEIVDTILFGESYLSSYVIVIA